MAYMGRGSSPSINNGNGADNNSEHVHYGPNRYYYVPLDNNYVKMQIIGSIAILIAGMITYIITYKSKIIDPIENTKKLIINTHLIIISVLVVASIIMHFFSKHVKILIRGLIVIFSISLVSMLFFCGIKLKMDEEYKEDKFEQIYLEQNISKESTPKSKVSLGLDGLKLKTETEKEYYVNEYTKLYRAFKLKTYGTLGLHIVLNFLLMYQINRVSKIKDKKDRISNDDLILFDDEQNVKY